MLVTLIIKFWRLRCFHSCYYTPISTLINEQAPNCQGLKPRSLWRAKPISIILTEWVLQCYTTFNFGAWKWFPIAHLSPIACSFIFKSCSPLPIEVFQQDCSCWCRVLYHEMNIYLITVHSESRVSISDGVKRHDRLSALFCLWAA